MFVCLVMMRMSGVLMSVAMRTVTMCWEGVALLHLLIASSGVIAFTEPNTSQIFQFILPLYN